jgi:hypothetical protein
MSYPSSGRLHPPDRSARRRIRLPDWGYANRGYQQTMTAWDDDDWTGEPPEGRISRDRAKPGFWNENRTPLSITGVGIGIALIILVVVWLL